MQWEKSVVLAEETGSNRFLPSQQPPKKRRKGAFFLRGDVRNSVPLIR